MWNWPTEWKLSGALSSPPHNIYEIDYSEASQPILQPWWFSDLGFFENLKNKVETRWNEPKTVWHHNGKGRNRKDAKSLIGLIDRAEAKIKKKETVESTVNFINMTLFSPHLPSQPSEVLNWLSHWQFAQTAHFCRRAKSFTLEVGRLAGTRGGSNNSQG